MLRRQTSTAQPSHWNTQINTRNLYKLDRRDYGCVKIGILNPYELIDFLFQTNQIELSKPIEQLSYTLL